jgi:hypothetical protein
MESEMMPAIVVAAYALGMFITIVIAKECNDKLPAIYEIVLWPLVLLKFLILVVFYLILGCWAIFSKWSFFDDSK